MFKKIILLFILTYSLQAKEFEKINLQLDWLHQFQFAGYYVAKEKGYYKEQKLLVNIQQYKFGLDLVDNVLKNENTYSAGKSSLIIDILNGKKLHLLTTIYQHSPMVLISLKKSNINNISDLIDKKVMLTDDAVSAASIHSMIKSEGVDLNTINFIPHSFKLEDLINGKTQAMGSYLSNEPYFLDKKNIEYKIFNPKDYGFDFYGGLLFTSQKEIQENPLRVKNFYEATIRGWEYAFSNIEETAKLIYEKYNSQNKSLDSLIYEAKILKELSGFDKGSFAQLNIKRINEMKRLYLLLGLAHKSNIDLKDFVYDKKSIILTKKEKEYLQENKIHIISEQDKPFSYIKNKKANGLIIDIWDELTGKELLNSDFKKIKHLDLYYTKDKKINPNKYILSKELISIPSVLITKINKNFINDLEVLSNETIAISKNSDFMEDIKIKYPKIKFIETKNRQEAYELLAQNKVFGIVSDNLSFSHLSVESFKDIKISATLPFSYNLYYYTAKENKMLIDIINKLSKELSQLQKETILNRYQVVLYKDKQDYSWIFKYLMPLIILLIYILFINLKLRKEITKRKSAENNLLYALNHDSLTSVYNRKKLESKIELEIEKSTRFDTNFSIIFFDIDDFKDINDTFGHLTGDKVLIQMAHLVKTNIRKIDSIGRWGGEEFVILLPQTNVDEAYNLANKLRILIEKETFSIQRATTASFGVSEFKKGNSMDELITRADDAMYLAKRNNKNTIFIN